MLPVGVVMNVVEVGLVVVRMRLISMRNMLLLSYSAVLLIIRRPPAIRPRGGDDAELRDRLALRCSRNVTGSAWRDDGRFALAAVVLVPEPVDVHRGVSRFVPHRQAPPIPGLGELFVEGGHLEVFAVVEVVLLV